MAPSAVTAFQQSGTAIEGLLVLQTKRAADERGTIWEMYRKSVIGELGPAWLPDVQQVNLTFSAPGAVRGLHGESMVKLVGVAHGKGYGAYLDARPGSPTVGTLVTLHLEPGTQLLVPAGVCNGFQALSPEGCLYLYCFDTEWAPSLPGVNVNPLDPAVAVPWPMPIDAADRTCVSAKDASLPTLAEVLQG
jgi:dTDP-4-dehydrorhamnose 3,5-epimerase